MSKSHTTCRWVLLTTGLLFSGCMALPFLIPPLVEFGANLLRTAVNNYGDTHEKNMENLLVSIQRPVNPMSQGIIATPYGQTGGYQPPGYFDQNYQTAQAYPPSQGYPSSQTHSSSQDYYQQGYDPYRTQQPQYGGNSSYPSTQYPEQGQQRNPFWNDPGYSNQSTPTPGYSSYPPIQNPQHNPPIDTFPPNQNYPNQNPYPGQIHQPPGTSYPLDQQSQSYSRIDGNPGMSTPPSYADQTQGSLSEPASRMEMTQLTAPPISLDVLLVKNHMVNGVPSYLPIKDGDILLDGRGNAQTGDKFRVMFRPHSNCYVYVIAVDGSAWAQGIFPTASSPFSNPVKAGQQYVLPEGTNWFSLDQYKGIETIFFVASHARRHDIEEVLATITGRERNPAEKPQAVSEPAIIPNGFSEARPSLSSFAFPVAKNQRQELLPTTYFVNTAGEDLRITRWFRHQ